jgi:fluoroacetyl-CoA thioesterase
MTGEASRGDPGGSSPREAILSAGLTARISTVVTAADTAIAAGSGDVPVLGTPRLLALAEAATVAAIAPHLQPGRTSVGTQVSLDHRKASPVGSQVEVSAELREVDGSRLVFGVTAADQDGAVLGVGTVHRMVVDRERFLGRLGRSAHAGS